MVFLGCQLYVSFKFSSPGKTFRCWTSERILSAAVVFIITEHVKEIVHRLAGVN